jgi:hypothetical protein
MLPTVKGIVRGRICAQISPGPGSYQIDLRHPPNAVICTSFGEFKGAGGGLEMYGEPPSSPRQSSHDHVVESRQDRL